LPPGAPTFAWLQIVVALQLCALSRSTARSWRRSIDLDVVLELPFAFEARVERLLAAVVGLTVALQQAPAFFRQHNRVLATARHAHGLDQSLFAKMPQVA
jgi:hypothetical protein